MTLVEKYRSTTWDGVYGNKHIITVLKRMIENDTTQHMIFVGRPGCGKTMLGRIFASYYLDSPINYNTDYRDYREMNASDERGIDVVRSNKVKRYCQTRAQNGKKRILFLDEADNLTVDAQRALRAIMQNNQDNVIIILSMNHLEMIKEEALLSRCSVFKFDPEPPAELKGFMLKVAKGEGIKFDNKELDDIIEDITNFPDYKGDFRRVINDTIQKLVGIDHPVSKSDIPWIYNESYVKIVDNIMSDLKKAFTIFWAEYRTRYIDCVLFIRQLFNTYRKNQQMSYELAKVFGTVEMNMKNGGDELIQMSYLLTALEVEV